MSQKGPTPAARQRAHVVSMLTQLNPQLLWHVKPEKLVENMGYDSARELESLLKNIRFYQERTEVVRQTTQADGQVLFHAAELRLRQRQNKGS